MLLEINNAVSNVSAYVIFVTSSVDNFLLGKIPLFKSIFSTIKDTLNGDIIIQIMCKDMQ